MQVVTPKVSVVMSVYKEPVDWIQQSIDSILNQTFKDYEFIIVSDNPSYTQGNLLLKQYSEIDSRIVLVFNEKNYGLTKSLNKAIAIAQGEYIARMDADDICMKERLKTQIEYMKNHPEIDVCGTAIHLFGDVSFLSAKIKKFPSVHQDIVLLMLFDNPYAHSSVMMKRIINEKIVHYDEEMLKAQDYKLWCDLYQSGAHFSNLDIPLLRYRISNKQISNNNKNDQNNTADIVRRLMLKGLMPEIASDDIVCHNETCKIVNGELLEKKLRWLEKLAQFIKDKNQLSACINSMLFRLWYSNCFLCQKTGMKVLKYPYLNCKLLFNSIFLKALLKKYYRR